MGSENDTSGQKKRGEAARSLRHERQAAALRDNLHRRKSQARSRREFDTSDGDMTADVAAAERPTLGAHGADNKER